MFKLFKNFKEQKKKTYKFSNLLAVILFGVAITVSFSTSLVILYLESGHLREELKETGIIIAKNLAFSSKEFLLNNDQWNLYKLCRSIIDEETTEIVRNKHHVNGIEYAMILNMDGILFAHSNPLNNQVGYPVSNSDIFSWNALKSDGLLIQESISGGYRLFNISLPIRVGTEKIGVVRIGISERELVVFLKAIRNEILLITLVIALLFGALSQLFSRWITSPLSELNRFAKSFPNTLVPEIDSKITEINSLGSVLSQLSIRIEDMLKDIYKNTRDIQEEKDKLESILNGIGAGLVVINRKLNVVWYNKVFSDWFDIINYDQKHCFNCLNKKSICKDCPTIKTFSTGTVQSAGQTRMTKQGEKYFKVITVPWKNERNEITQIFELSMDISDKAELEKKLKSSEQAALIGDLSAAMAHEIRNPLSSLVSSINLLYKKVGYGLSSDDQKSLIDVINKESHRLSVMLDDFLKYGRKKEMKVELCNVSLILDEIVNIARYRQDIRNRVIFSKNTNNSLPLIYADKEMLQQAFWNLIINSMDAIKGSGTINLTIQEKREFLEVLIRDTGCGIPSHIKHHIFEPFHSTKQNGTGLGLAIAKKMIAMHSGTINVIESSEKGTTFLIGLPVCKKTIIYHG